jgi:hypothetical protein
MKEHWTERCRHFIIMSGKSGSTSLHHSIRDFLNKKGISKQTVGCHGINDFNRRMFGGNHDWAKKFGLNDVLLKAQKFWKEQNENIFIYDAFRTPIERSFSAFVWHNQDLLWELSAQEMLKTFYDRDAIYKESYLAHEEIDLKQFGFDVNSFKYDSSKKCIHQKKDNVHFIGLRFDQIKQWPNIINNIEWVGDFNMQHKFGLAFNERYKRCVNELKVPSKFLLELKHSLNIPQKEIKNQEIAKKVKSFRKYCNQKEIDEYINFWRQKVF